MSLKGARVLLTGGTGFIGARVAAALHAAGARVSLLARSSSSGSRLGALWNELPRHPGDLADAGSLVRAARAVDPEYVVHLAKDRRASGFEAQAKASAALAAALALGAKRLRRWVRTAHAGGARGADEALARLLAEKHGLELCTLELFLVYGPGQRPGDYPLDLVDAALAGLPMRPSAEPKDLVFVDDAARAYLAAAESPRAAGAWIPVGGGRLVPALECARAAAAAAGRGEPEFDRLPPPDGGGHPADTAKAKELLGWSPAVSLDEGMRQLVQWRKDGRAGLRS